MTYHWKPSNHYNRRQSEQAVINVLRKAHARMDRLGYPPVIKSEPQLPLVFDDGSVQLCLDDYALSVTAECLLGTNTENGVSVVSEITPIMGGVPPVKCSIPMMREP